MAELSLEVKTAERIEVGAISCHEAYENPQSEGIRLNGEFVATNVSPMYIELPICVSHFGLLSQRLSFF